MKLTSGIGIILLLIVVFGISVVYDARTKKTAATEFNQRVKAAEDVTRSLEREICGGLQSPIQIVLPPKELPNEVPRVVIGGKAFKPEELRHIRLATMLYGRPWMYTAETLANQQDRLHDLIVCPP